MNAIQFNLSIPRYLAVRSLSPRLKSIGTSSLSCLSLRQVDIPPLVDENWVRVRTRNSGICGTDLSVINGKSSFYLEPFAAESFILGHEVVGEVVEIGPAVESVQEGDRVVIEPSHSCVTRGITQQCPSCRLGHTNLCHNLANGHLAPGTSIGYSQDTGGGWGEYFVAHHSQVHPLPDALSLEEAVLVEPFAVALHAVLRRYPPDGAKVLVLGSGTVGLLTVAALKMLPVDCQIYATAKYEFQKELALEMGADLVINPSKEDLYQRIAEECGAKMFKPSLGKRVVEGGVQRCYDSVATPATIDDALRLTEAGGSVVLVGSASDAKGIDLTPVWFREVDLVGSYIYSVEEFQGSPRRTFDLAIDLMVQNEAIPLRRMVTHRFQLEDWKDAIRTAQSHRESGSVKVVFDFN